VKCFDFTSVSDGALNLVRPLVAYALLTLVLLCLANPIAAQESTQPDSTAIPAETEPTEVTDITEDTEPSDEEDATPAKSVPPSQSIILPIDLTDRNDQLRSDLEPWIDPEIPFAERLTRFILQPKTIVRNVEIDSATSAIMLTERYKTSDVKIPRIVDVETYARQNLERSTRQLLSTQLKAVIQDEFRDGEGRGNKLGFEVPFPVESETFQKVFGGSGVSLMVNGQVNLQASAVQQKEDMVKDALNRGSDLQFKLEQQQRFNIEGKVGDKVSILVDQDSERDFDFDNNMRIFYTGEDDEIVESLQAGNIALNLPGTQFVTFSAANQGLFGLKSQMKIGGIDLTTIASLEKGEKQKLTLQGGNQTQATIVEDYRYLRDIYFFLDHRYRDNYAIVNGLLRTAAQDDWITEIVVWEAGVGYNTQLDTRPGWAFADPINIEYEDPPANTKIKASPEQVRGSFKRLTEGQDYVVFKEIGYIFMTQPIRDKTLAVAYRTANGQEYGMVRPPESQTEDIHLKLIRNQNPRPGDTTFDLAWKHAYSLGAGNIPREGLEIAIVDNRDPSRSEINVSTGSNYIEIFELDNQNEAGAFGSPDNKVDADNVNMFNLLKGHLIFPNVRPFSPQAGSNPKWTNSERHSPEIYDTLFVNNSDWKRISKFDIEVKTSAAQSTYNLGFNTLPGSEEVMLDGVMLQKGADYDIDYTFGTLTIKNPKAGAPGANLDIKYESGQLFQLDKKTLMGSRAEYHFWENSFIGATAIKLSESILESRVKVGQEPVSNMVWDVNTRLDFEPEVLTDWLNAIPLIATDQPSRVVFEAEMGQVMPNPNTLNSKATGDNAGVAFLDDFEGAKRENLLNVSRRGWVRASLPLVPPIIMPGDSNLDNFIPIPKDDSDRGRFIWYNPYNQIELTDIYPTKETNERTGRHQNVLTLERRFDDNHHPTPIPDNEWWAGVMTYLPVSFQNQADTKFIEVMLQGTKGVVHFEMGLISEDQNGDGIYQTEDFNGEQAFENGILDKGEDIGLDGIEQRDGPGTAETYDDDWEYASGKSYYLNINGIEGNSSGKEVDGLLVPDTEDISRNGTLNTENEFYSYTINLDPSSPSYQKYIAGGSMDAVNEDGDALPDKGWRLFRIPIRDFTYKIGNPDLTRLEYSRIWVEGLDLPTVPDNPLVSSEAQFGTDWSTHSARRVTGLLTNAVSVASISLISSDWKEEAEIVSLDENLMQNPENIIGATVANTEENASYRSPPGVDGVEDRLTGVKLREQALVLKYEQLPPRNAVAIKKALMEVTDIIHYEQLKMFVHGPTDSSIIVQDDSVTNMEYFMRIGRDEDNFYEVRGYLFPGWDSSRPFDDGSGGDGSDRNEIFIPVNRLATLPLDSLVTPEWGRGRRFRKVGQPTIRQLQIMTLGLINRGDYHLTSEVWFDELRVSQVEKSKGKAVRARMDVTLADLGMISADITMRDADFHTVNEHFGTGSNTDARNVTAQMNLARLISSEPSWSIPVSMNMNSTASTPKYLSGTDVLFGLAEEDSINHIYHSKSEVQERNITRTSANSFNFSVSKVRESKHWWLRYTIDKANYSFGRTQSKSSDYNTKTNSNTGLNHSFGWDIAFYQWMPQPFKFLGENTFLLGKLAQMKIGFIPTGFNFTSGLSENSTANEKFGGKLVEQTTAAMNRTMSSGVKLFPNLSVNISQSYQNDLSDTTRTGSAIQSVMTGNLGRLRSKNQTMTGNFNPKVFQFLTHSFSYNTTYSLNNNIQLPTAGKSTQNSTTMSARLNLDISRMLGISRSGSSRARRPAAPRTPTPGKEGEEPEEEGGEFFMWSAFKGLVNRISPLSSSWSTNTAVQNVGLQVEPGWLYRIGIDKNPTNMPDSITVVGTMQNSQTLRETISLGTGFRLISSMKLTFNYDQSTSESNKGTSRSGNESVSYLVYGDKRMPFFNWSYNWSGLERIWPMGYMFNTLSLDHKYSGTQSRDLRSTKIPEMEGMVFAPTTENYTSSYSPFVRLNMNIKGGITGGFNMNKSEQIGKDLLVGTESRTTQSDLSVNASWSKAGIRIPIPFMKRRLENNINFNLTFDMNNTSTFRQIPEDGSFVKNAAMSRWNARSEIGYSITSKVTGRAHFQLGKSNSIRQGTTSMKDYGFSVDIRIEGSGT
jgi:hypothetical protein